MSESPSASVPGSGFGALSAARRREILRPTPCRPLPDAATAIALALARFDESWRAYRSVTPTLYPIGPGRGRYATLGRLRRRWRLDWTLVEAAVAALGDEAAGEGFLLASEAAGGSPLRTLFALQGHHHGERHHGALELATLRPFEGDFVTEFDDPDGWRLLRTEARSNDGFDPG